MMIGLNSKTSELIVESATDGDIEDLCELFSAVFESPIDRSFWTWKYGNDRGHSIVARKDGRIIAHYGGVKRHIVWNREIIPSIQCVDTMVASTGRHTVGRNGAYSRVARHFLDRYVGENRPYLFGFGFPNERVMRLGEILGIQAAVATVVEPWWSTDDVEVPGYLELCPDSKNFENILDKLWSQMWDKFPGLAVCARDVGSLYHRYIDHPVLEYGIRIVVDSESAQPVGAFVLRNEGQSMLLLDLVGDPLHFPRLVDCARLRSAKMGLDSMSAWITEPHVDMLGGKHEKILFPGVRVPTSVCTPGPEPSTLEGRWWLMAGDTDFR